MTDSSELVERLHAIAAERVGHPDEYDDAVTADISAAAFALSAKDAEIERLTRERDACRLEAQIQAGEARGANATINESYQAITGATGEPGNWHGARPIKELVADRDRLSARLDEAVEALIEVDGCFEAALFEGWNEALANDEIERLQDIFNRRIAFARTAAIAFLSAQPSAASAASRNVQIEHDGFAGTVIGNYTTREGKLGLVVQQHGTRVVHVYGEKWAKDTPVPSAAEGEK